MPGFNSFLLGRGHFTSYVPDSPPSSDSDSEPEAVQAAMRRVEKQQNAKVTTLFDTSLTRLFVEHSHETMKKLRDKLKEQDERFHDAGLASKQERKVLLQAFAEANRIILRDGGATLSKMNCTTGPLEDLAEGLRVLGRVVGEIGEKMDVQDAERLQKVLRNEVGKPLVELVRAFRGALEDRSVWRKAE